MITGVVLARNEAHNIVECLQSLQPYVEEMLLIDMESDDNTMELSRPLVSKVLTHPLVDNFDPARNIATEHAQHDWLWFLDADERVPASVGEVVRDLVRKHGDQYAAINIPFRTYFCGRWIKHCGWWPGYTMPRVLKRGHFRFAEKLHGGVEVDGPQLRVSAEPDLAIEHYSYRSVEHYVEKFNRYTSTEARQLASQGQAFEWSEATRHMIRELWNYYEHHSGHQDGEQGWILSWLSGQYRWLTHAKLLDAAPSQEHAPSIPGSLDDVLQVMQDELDRVRRLKPQLPLGVVLRSPIWDCSGYADEGRAIARALSNGSRELTIEPINWSSQSCSISEDETALLRALTRTTRPRHAITITNCIPTLCEPDPKAVLNVLRTTFETDRIPPEWLPRIEAFDEVWVISQHNRRAFVRSGLPPERVHVVPSLMDVRPYRIPGTPFTLPAPLQDRFVFLSVFDWQLRKGWDVLLDAYCREFSVADGVGLLLKISRLHGCSAEGVQAQANAVLERTGTTLPQRPDIVILDEMLTAEELRRLYGSVDAFVLASRGEGWGRPYMEAMAAGLPTIGTAASGNIDFMDESNSYLIPAQLVDVPDVAAQEIPPYRGHCWYEPDRESLQTTMRKVFVDAERREQVGARGRQCVEQRYDLAAGLQQLQAAVRATEVNHLDVAPVEAAPDAISVQLEGELFAGHSFSNINERLAMGLGTDGAFDFSIQRQFLHPPIDGHSPHAHRLEPFVGRQLAKDPEVTIRHAFPPNWEKPATGKWVHVQPWEFGHLPRAWLGPLQNDVDEIWCPSEYVRRVYVQSGIPEEKLHVIPWGFDPEFFSPDVPARLLPTQKGFRFLFVGGTIARKGFDVLLDAYLEEFGPDEDVCLVVKDVGSQSFYRVGNDRERIFTAQQDATAPEILYRDDQLTRGQLASLYTACDCLVAPYRGEGFGLPILEAMACGLPPIVPRAGASDDFVSDENGYRIASEEIETQHEWELCGPATELQIDVSELRRAMRHVFEQRQQCKARGLAAAKHVHQHCTWEQSIDAMKERIKAFCYQGEIKSLAACVVVHNHERTLGDCLSRLAPHVDQLLVIDGGSTDRSRVIAAEYGATISDSLQAILAELARSDGWCLLLNGNERVDADQLEGLRSQLALQSRETSAATVVCSSRDNSQTTREVRLLRCSPPLLSRMFAQPWATVDDLCAQMGAVTGNLELQIHSANGSPLRIGAGRAGLVERWLVPYVPAEGRVFVDVGANTGTWSKSLAWRFDGVHAIEPHPQALAGLRSSMPENVTVHPCGAWDRDEEVAFAQFESSLHNSAYFEQEGINTGERRGTLNLPCRTIDSLDITGPVDFLKCDVEGAELKALSGAADLIARDRPWLIVEVHSKENYRGLTRLLDEWGYVFTIVRDPNYEPFSELWHSHCWFACQPEESASASSAKRGNLTMSGSDV